MAASEAARPVTIAATAPPPGAEVSQSSDTVWSEKGAVKVGGDSLLLPAGRASPAAGASYPFGG